MNATIFFTQQVGIPGETAEFKGVLYGITVLPNNRQKIAARHLSGDITQYYEGSLLMNILKMHGTDLVSPGFARSTGVSYNFS